MAKRTKQANALPRPSVFGYHDYRAYLKDWLAWAKSTQPRFSLRALAKASDLTVAYLSMVLAGKRPLTGKSQTKLSLALKLSDPESDVLGLLVTLAEADSAPIRNEALRKLQQFRNYQSANPSELEIYRYLSHWYYVGIRELAALEDFEADAKWIRARLRVKLTLQEIEQALSFLKDHGYLTPGPGGRLRPAARDVDCLGGVYRIALGQFHSEMLSLATQSIENTPSAERMLLGRTFAVSSGQFDQLKEILDEAFKKIILLEESRKVADSVYHVELAAFPLTQGAKKK